MPQWTSLTREQEWSEQVPAAVRQSQTEEWHVQPLQPLQILDAPRPENSVPDLQWDWWNEDPPQRWQVDRQLVVEPTVFIDITSTADFRAFCKETFLRNKLFTHRLTSTAESSGALGVSDFAKSGNYGNRPGNLHRDIMRHCLKDINAPEPYYAEVPTRDPRTAPNNVMVNLPFLLVHELLAAMVDKSGVSMREHWMTYRPLDRRITIVS